MLAKEVLPRPLGVMVDPVDIQIEFATQTV